MIGMRCKRRIARTHRWLRRCREAHPDDRLVRPCLASYRVASFPDLRQASARFVTEMDLKGYAIGGLAVGESKPEMYQHFG